MSRKFYINANVERLISFAASLLLILALNIVLAKTLLKKIQKASTEAFIQHCMDVTEDYAEAVSTKLDLLTERTSLFYAKIAFKSLSDDEIRKILSEEKDSITPPFSNLVYANKDGMSWNVFGDVVSVTDRDYYQKIISEEKGVYISDILEEKNYGSAIIAFAIPIRNENYEISGLLSALCPLEKIDEFLNEINIAAGEKITIRDSQDRFIKHYKTDWQNQIFSPEIAISTEMSTEYTAEPTMRTRDTDGNSVHVFFKVLKNAPWTIGLTVQDDEFKKIERNQSKYQYLIIETIVIVLSLIFLLEIWMHNFLEKKQILSTHIDSVTHLLSQAFFEKEVNRMLKKYPNSKFVMIETDIRGFKFINQDLGKSKADQILYQYSRLLYQLAKTRGGVLSRGYADIFYCFFKINTVHETMHDFKKTVRLLSEEIKKFEVQFVPKFGIAFYIPQKNEETISAQALIGRATFAKKSIKDNALQNYAIYDKKLLNMSSKDNYIENHMEMALENREFFLMYQPKMNLLTDKIVGAEALVRWENQELGFMPPNAFIPLFEKNNFIVKLDFYVYEEVFRFLRKCIDKGEPTVPISVNMSRNHHKPEKFVHDFVTLLRKYDIPPSLIEVELLERRAEGKNVLREVTLLLQKEGFKVAMDDFGTGESSLNMLSTIPVNILKFDRSFLFASDSKNGTLDATSENFIETLIDLGKGLKKETIFEGVETEAQRDFLRKIKCDQVQGFFYSKPLRENEYMEFLKKHR